jgi:hypothetical protein
MCFNRLTPPRLGNRPPINCEKTLKPNHYSGDGPAATKQFGEYQMNWWVDSVAKAIRPIKADYVSLKLQNEFCEKRTHLLDTQP